MSASVTCSNVKCKKLIDPQDALFCVCSKVSFCCKEHFEQDPHSSIEDDEHGYMNELATSTIEVKLSRLVGRGKYVDIMVDLTNKMTQGKISEYERDKIADRFAAETSKFSSAVRIQIVNLIDSFNAGTISNFKSAELVRIWQKDSPRSSIQIEMAMKRFLAAASYLVNNFGDPGANGSLINSAITLGMALNGDRTKVE